MNQLPHDRGMQQPGPTRIESQQDDEIDLAKLLSVAWAGKINIAAFSVIALTIGATFYAVTPPTYQADALLQLEERSGSLALPASMRDMVDNDPRTVTEIEIIRSRLILGQAVAALNLDWQAQPMLAPFIGQALARYNLPVPELSLLESYARVGDGISLNLLEVPPAWLNQSMVLTQTSTGYDITTVNGQVLSGVVGQTLRLEEDGFALHVAELNGRSGRAFLISQIAERRAIEQLRQAITVAERGRASGMLDVRVTAGQPDEAARILAAVTQAYVRQNISRSAAEAESSLEFIEAQLPQAEAAVREAERALNTYRQQQSSVDLSFETQNILTQINAVEAELRQLQMREDEISQRYTASHPVYRQLLTERARLDERLANLRRETGGLPETQREVLNLSRNLEIQQEIFTQLLTRAQEVSVLRASTIGNVRIVDSAQAQGAPIAPRRNRILALALALGASLGVGYVLLRNWMRKGVQTPQELEQMGLPVFATINYSIHADTKQKRKGNLPILAITEPTDLAVEGFRSLRTSLHFGMLDAKTRTLAVTSSAPGAGKSFASLNLAVVAAEAGQRVCLVDADMRRGQLRRYFQVERNRPGLAEVLAGEITLDEALIDGPVTGMSFLPTGRYPPNPSELLMRRELQQFTEQLNERFDLSILDCPPALAVTDPVIISRAVGATIAVVRHDVTPLGEVHALQKIMESSGVRMSGVVLNGFDPRKARTYGYGYGYRYDYKQRSN